MCRPVDFRLFCVVICLFVAIACFVSPVPIFAADGDEANSAAARDFNAAAALQNTGLYARAADKWTAFLTNHPKYERLPEVQYHLGICQMHIKKYAEALKVFQGLIAAQPNFPQIDGVRFNLGMTHFEAAQEALAAKQPADFAAAAAALADMATKHPQSKHAPRAIYYQADALYQAQKPAEAIAAYKKLIATYADSPLVPNALYYQGVTEQETGEEVAAVATFTAFLAKPELAQHELAHEVRLRLGNAQFNLKQFAEAEKVFIAVAAVEKFPFVDLALLRIAQCQLESGTPAGGIPRLLELIAKFPESTYLPAAKLTLGKCYYLTDKLAESQQTLTPLVALNLPESPEAAYWLGRVQLKQEKAADALATLEAAVKAFTEGDFAPYLAALRIDALYDLPERRKETPPLYAEFVKTHAEHPLAPQAQYMAALSALGQEDFAAAKTQSEAFLANPKLAEHELTPACLYVAAEANLLATGIEPKPTPEAVAAGIALAEKNYRELITEFPMHARVPLAQLRVGWCLYQAKKYDEGVQYLTGIVAAIKDPAQTAECQLLIGRCHASAGRDKEAVVALDAALQALPTWPRVDEVLITSAQSLRAVANLPEATKRLQLIVASHPMSIYREQAMYQLGEIAQTEKSYDDAVARYKEVLAQFPQGKLVAAANYGLAAVLFAKEDYQGSLAPLAIVVAAKDDAEIAARGLYLRGLAQRQLEQFQPALTDLQAFLATKPQPADALDTRYAIALCQVGLKQLAPAIETLNGILAEKPDYVHADKVYYELGHALAGLEKPAESAVAFTTLATKLPESPLVAESLFYVGRNHEDQAVAGTEEAKKTAALKAAGEAYAAGLAKAETPALKEKLAYKLGDMQFRQAQYELASATLLKEITDFPKGELIGPARFLAAESLFRMDKFEQALPLFVQVATDKVEKYHDQSLYQAGNCASKLKNWPASQSHYAALLQLFPKFELATEAKYGLAFALHQQNKGAEARPLYEQVTKETETETAAKARFMVGELDFAEKKFEDAIEQFLFVSAGYPYKTWQSRAQLEAGRCFMELKDKTRAVQTLQVIVEKFPDQIEVEDAKKLIAELSK